jgi:hypothetical protein
MRGESTEFNSWLDGMGHPHSEAMRVMERYRAAISDTWT